MGMEDRDSVEKVRDIVDKEKDKAKVESSKLCSDDLESSYRSRQANLIYIASEKLGDSSLAGKACIIFHKYVNLVGYNAVLEENEIVLMAAVLFLVGKINEKHLSLTECLCAALILQDHSTELDETKV